MRCLVPVGHRVDGRPVNVNNTSTFQNFLFMFLHRHILVMPFPFKAVL